MKRPASLPAATLAALALLPLSLVSLSLGGCGTAKRGEPVAGPFTPSSPAVADGQQVFMHNCNECHPGGESGVGPALNNLPVPSPAIKLKVRKGVVGMMPKFDEQKISDEQLDHLVEYLKELRAHHD